MQYKDNFVRKHCGSHIITSRKSEFFVVLNQNKELRRRKNFYQVCNNAKLLASVLG